MYATPTEVALAFKEQFGVIIGRDQVAKYDPTGAAAHKLADKWKQRYTLTREAFDKETRGSRIASRAWRIKRLEELERTASRKSMIAEARACLEQAAKEVGDSYTNIQRIKHTGSVKTAIEHRLPDEVRSLLGDKLMDAVEKKGAGK